MSTAGDAESKVGMLYGQIIFEIAWQRRTRPSELDRLSLVLASIAHGVLRRPLPLNVLGTLASPDDLSISGDIEKVVEALSSIIVTEGDDKIPRVRHQSISDFLLKKDRVDRVVKRLLGRRKDLNLACSVSEESGVFNTFYLEHQHTVVAEGCRRLMEKCMTGAFPKTDVSAALVYACAHWADHLQGAGDDSKARGDLCLVPSIKTFPDLQDRVFLWMASLSVSSSVYKPYDELLALQSKFDSKAIVNPESAAVLKALELTTFTRLVMLVILKAFFVVRYFIFGPSEKEKQMLDTIRVFTKAHPITSIILDALNTAYDPCKEGRDVIKALVRDMCDSLKFMANVHPESKPEYAELCAVELVKIVSASSQLVTEFSGSSKITDTCNKDATKDFREKVFGYQSQMRNSRREAILVHKLVNEGVLNNREEIQSFLQHRLKPVKQLSTDEICLNGTREIFLSTVGTWLKSSEMVNVLWISGAAGTGKTTLASTIVETLSNSHFYRFYGCAKFSIKERDANLRDPRAIWRSISAQLADLYRSVQLDDLEFLSGNAGGIYPGDDGIQNQFRNLISEPLRKEFSIDSGSFRQIVVVIDGLDECGTHTGSKNEQSTLLDTITNWNKELPWTCKLIVTSRPEAQIEAKLRCGSFVHRLDLDSKLSNADIQLFFETTFGEMKADKRGWSSPGLIRKLTQAADGVFAWATTIIEFIRSNSAVKPEEVLADMVQKKGEVEDIGNLDYLYGKILLKVASQLEQSGLQYLNALSVVLASVSLPRNSITFESVCKLLPPDCPSSIVKSVIDKLGPVICLSGNEDKNMYAHHRSFSDFLRDVVCYETTMKSVANTSSAKHDSIVSALSLARQRSLFKGGYFRLLNTCCQRAYPFVIELAGVHVQHNEKWSKEIARRLSDSDKLQPDREPSDQLDALFLLTDAWLRFQLDFASSKMEALRGIVNMCQQSVSTMTDVNPSYIWFVLMVLLDPNAMWSGQHKCTDDVKALAINLRESLESTDTPESPVNAGSKQSQAAMAFLENLAAAFKCVDDFAARFTHSSEIRSSSFDKYRAFLEIYQSSMKYWELELRGIGPRNLEGSVDVDWSDSVGEGGFTKVYVGSAQMDNREVAVAVRQLMRWKHGDREDTTATAEREHRLIEGFVEASRIWSQFNHPNVSKCLGYILRDHSIAVVNEFAYKGDLHKIMSAPEFGIHEAFAASLGIAKGMCFLHHIGVLHGDLKSPNVLVSDSGEALINMSTCTVYDTALQDGEVRVSQRWAPYEYYHLPAEGNDNFQRTQKSDVWAFGMTVLELLTGKWPYAHHMTDGRVIRAIMERVPRELEPTIDDSEPDAGLKRFMWSICLKCWRFNPEERPSMREILEEMLDYPLETSHSVVRKRGTSRWNRLRWEESNAGASTSNAYDSD